MQSSFACETFSRVSTYFIEILAHHSFILHKVLKKRSFLHLLLTKDEGKNAAGGRHDAMKLIINERLFFTPTSWSPVFFLTPLQYLFSLGTSFLRSPRSRRLFNSPGSLFGRRNLHLFLFCILFSLFLVE